MHYWLFLFDYFRRFLIDSKWRFSPDANKYQHCALMPYYSYEQIIANYDQFYYEKLNIKIKFLMQRIKTATISFLFESHRCCVKRYFFKKLVFGF